MHIRLNLLIAKTQHFQAQFVYQNIRECLVDKQVHLPIWYDTYTYVYVCIIKRDNNMCNQQKYNCQLSYKQSPNNYTKSNKDTKR